MFFYVYLCIIYSLSMDLKHIVVMRYLFSWIDLHSYSKNN